jgi:type IV pilus assembly protein PilW
MCPTLNLGVGANLISDGANFTPVQARRVGLNDVLEVVYGSDVSSGAAVSATSPDALSATLESFLPASVNQSVLIAPDGVVAPCTVRSVTGVTPATPVLKQVLALDAGGTYNQAAFTNVPAHPLKSRVALLGNLQWNRYEIDANRNLVLTRRLDGRSAKMLRNVMGFRVEYGTASAASGGSMLDSWQSPTDVGWAAIDNTNIGWVRALRAGVVVRSEQREKPNANGVCEASTAKPQLFGKVIEPDVVDWQCYRYRSAVFVAPLRNIVYGLKAL